MSGATTMGRVQVRCNRCGFEDVVTWEAPAGDARPDEDQRLAVAHWAASHRGGCEARWASGPVNHAVLVGPLGPHLVERSPSRDWLTGGAA